jgi:RNase H-like domain found in reverse transcriptase
LANYYRRFIKGFGSIAAPLAALFKQNGEDKRKNRPVIWSTACQVAFNRLKQALMNAPVLHQPDPAKPYTIETDASDFAIGYALMQEGDDSLMHPIAFDGRKLQGAELRYPIHEKELLAIKEALTKWRHYIENNHKTTVLTDHESLRYMNSITKPSKRLARWIDEFQGYDLDIRYRKGREAIVPDALSRRPDFMSNELTDVVNAITQDDKYSDLVGHLKEYLTSKTLPLDATMRERVLRHADGFVLDKDESLCKKLKNGSIAPFIEPSFRGDFMEWLHTQFGHLSYSGITNAVET